MASELASDQLVLAFSLLLANERACKCIRLTLKDRVSIVLIKLALLPGTSYSLELAGTEPCTLLL